MMRGLTIRLCTLCGFFYIAVGFSICTGLRAQVQQQRKSTAGARKPQKVVNPLNSLLDQAQAAMDRKDYQAALESLNKFVNEKPDVAYGHFQLGYAYTGLERWRDAQSEYRRAIELDPKLAAAHLNLGLLLMDHDASAAVEPLRKAVELLPAESRPKFLLGLALERSGKLIEAADAYQGAERANPRDYEVEFALGRTLLRLDRPGEAEKKFRVALDLKSDSAPARLGLANCLFAQRKPEAATQFEAYLKQQPQDAESREHLARMHFEKEEFPQAAAELDRAETAAAPTLDSLKLRADIAIAQKNWDAAIAALQRALQVSPRDAGLHAGLGRIYLEKRDFSAAEKSLRASLAIDSGQASALHDLGTVFYLQGNFPAALEALDLLAKRETPLPGAWFVRAICYDKLERKKEALESYQKFIDLDKDRHEDQVFQARQRIKLLTRELQSRK